MAEHAFALIDSTFSDFLADDLLVKPAAETWERQDYYVLRRAVFCAEQQLLAQDKDDKDFQAIPIVAVAHHCGMPEQVVGAVRIYESTPGTWYGGRLCVERAYRRHGMIGKALVNEAVSRAIDLGCRTFLATVQQANESYFHSLHWQTLRPMELLGQPHCLMQAELECYPFMPRQVALVPRKVIRHD
ncbi:MSMEG_0567/Sll0786 family nitrogen starvation N-acetyltransferase [Pseudomonas gingeri]|uniref:MSMEG_0567/Sll0786 family nitrogen starvation N-acetyltransferase n=1 Tax=Pseudomonas gingeri TaxID=117681 RepID=UPI0015A47620|nr:MSMEG_0567/Sll0786 family nitrogen starvation N-acetyltransferase [Pseudomonas gingeri]NWE50597.1 GNAT family N-acetyltransferase [Pseudomonas gingeri]